MTWLSHAGGRSSNQGSIAPPNTAAAGQRSNARQYAATHPSSTRVSSSVQRMYSPFASRIALFNAWDLPGLAANTPRIGRLPSNALTTSSVRSVQLLLTTSTSQFTPEGIVSSVIASSPLRSSSHRFHVQTPMETFTLAWLMLLTVALGLDQGVPLCAVRAPRLGVQPHFRASALHVPSRRNP